MVIKLIQIDSEDPFKITLSPGDHFFGRGKLLRCDDKRISRNHGELHVLEDSIEIKALHQNPCFYTKKGTEDKEVLQKDFSITLSTGDRFGLLPDAFWYEVVHCVNGQQETAKEDTAKHVEQTTDETINENNSPSIIPNNSEKVSDFSKQSINHLNNNDTEVNTVTVKRTHSIEQNNVDNIKKVKTESVNVMDTKIDIGPTEVQTTPINVQAVPSGGQNARTEVQNVPTKVKTEPVEVKTGPTEVKTEPTDSENNNIASVDVKQENDAGGSSGNQVANNDGAANGNARPPRERCMYGADCYRRNPAHFVQFCHPSDADWGSGAQAPCPFGAGCIRRDLRHFRDHSHPPEHRPPPPPGRRRKRRGSSYSPPPGLVRRKRNPSSWSGSDDDASDASEDTDTDSYDDEIYASQRAWRGSSYSPPPGMLVRLRKKDIQRLERRGYRFSSDDDEESDPFDTDGTDEWEPGHSDE